MVDGHQTINLGENHLAHCLLVLALLAIPERNKLQQHALQGVLVNDLLLQKDQCVAEFNHVFIGCDEPAFFGLQLNINRHLC